MKEHSMRAARAEATTTSPTLTAGPRSPHRSALGLLVLVLGVLAQALVAPAPARAFRCLRFGCPAWCGPVPMTLTSLSADLEAIAAGTTRSTVDQAFTDWTRVSCTSLEVSVTESLSGGIPFFGDGASHVGFVETDWPFDPNAIGISDVQVMSGCITEADTLLNGQNFTWVLGAGDAGLVNAYGALLHESGHLYGLGHSQEARSVMWFLYRGGRPILEQDDFDGICDLYPRAGAPADCAVTGCPLGWACEASVCEPLGTAGCIRHEDCEDDERCDAVTGACVVGVPTGDVLGAPCVDDLDCLSGLCAQLTTGGVCTEACDGLAPRAVACPTGFLCDGDAVGVCGTGLCLAGPPRRRVARRPLRRRLRLRQLHVRRRGVRHPVRPAHRGGLPQRLRLRARAGRRLRRLQAAPPAGRALPLQRRLRRRLLHHQRGRRDGRLRHASATRQPAATPVPMASAARPWATWRCAWPTPSGAPA
jgi:hypothetical protein